MSRPRATSAARACGGTSLLLRCGAIESSIFGISIMFKRSGGGRQTNRGDENQTGLAAPLVAHWNGESRAAECWDLSAHRRRAGPWHQWPTVSVLACTPEEQK